MLSDLRFATRILLHSRGFALTAIAILTLGIGATTTMFSATDAVLLEPLPYPDPARLVVVRETRAQAMLSRTVIAPKEYLDWSRQSRVIQDATIVDYPGLAVSIDGPPDRLPALRVTADFFPLFGVRPVVGRAFTREEERPGRSDVALLTYGTWKTRFGGARDVVGRAIRIEGRAFTVIGVLPSNFRFPGAFNLVIPLTFTPQLASNSDSHSLDVYARLAPGVTRTQAEAELSRVALETQGQPTHLTGVALVPMKDDVVGDASPLLVMFGAVGFVLLIACANIANLLLARGQARQKELAIRTALGAGRGRVIRQLVTESLLLSSAGCVAGALLATWLSDLLAQSAADSIRRASEIHMDPRGLMFAVAISFVAGVLFGLPPAWHTTRGDVIEALKQEGRGSSATRQRALATFVVTEIALALILLVGAGLMLATFDHLRRVDPGFDSTHALVVPAFLPASRYGTQDLQRRFFDRTTAALRAIPGIDAVGATNAVPLSGDNSTASITIEGAPPPTPAQRPIVERRSITPGFFDAMGIRLLSGRPFAATDDETDPPVAIVSRAFAATYWPGTNAVGRRVKLGRYETVAPWSTVIGVVNDVQHASLSSPPPPVIYYPYAQAPRPDMQIVVRARVRPQTVAVDVRTVMRRIDPDLPVSGLQPMDDFVASSLNETELRLSLLGAFAVMALALAAAGVYGVMAYAVEQRRKEFGIRLALGASRADVVRLVAGNGLRITVIGLTIGLVGARLSTSLLEGMVFGVRPADPFVFSSMAALLGATGMAACVIPAVRAMRGDPVDALRGR